MGYGYAEIIGAAAGALGLSIAIPQTIKILKAHNHEGVSITTWILMLLNYSAWIGFSIKKDSPSQIAANLIGIIITSILVYILINQNIKNVYITLTIMAGLTFTATTLPLFLPEILMNIFLTTLIFAKLPQVLTSYRSWKTGAATTVSTGTYTLMLLSSAGWATYGYITGLWMNVFSSAAGIILSLAVLLLEIGAQHKYNKTIQQ